MSEYAAGFVAFGPAAWFPGIGPSGSPPEGRHPQLSPSGSPPEERRPQLRPSGSPPEERRPPLRWARDARHRGSYEGSAEGVPPRTQTQDLLLVQAPLSDEIEAERLLCERAHSGDREALGSILRTYGPRLFRSVLLPRLGTVASAEEALSTTYVKVVERFAQFSWQSVGVYPWLRVVALRVALDQIRSRKRERLYEPVDLEREIDAAEHDARDADVIERYDLLQARQRVERLLGRINPRYAQAIRLRVLEERSRDEAARELGVSLGTFDVVLHRAMAALRKALENEGFER